MWQRVWSWFSRGRGRVPPFLGASVVLIGCCEAATPPDYTILHAFNLYNPDGTPSDEVGMPYLLIQATDGNFYGATGFGGGPDFTGSGKVFRMTPDGTITLLPTIPSGPFIQGRDGNLYISLPGGQGSIVKAGLDGSAVTVLHEFDGPHGSIPGVLLEARDGTFYGMTRFGGATNSGTVFRITVDGTFSLLHSFQTSEGEQPESPLVQAADGALYGTTPRGGSRNEGTLFRMTPDGDFTVLHHFGVDPGDGVVPISALTEGHDGRLYGTTLGGGVFGYGTAFRAKRTGEITILHSFSLDPANTGAPIGRLMRASDGYLYGTTGYTGLPSIYRMTPGGTVTYLHMSSGADGFDPTSLLHARDGDIYGVAPWGGPHNDGVAFRLRNPSPCDDTVYAAYDDGSLRLSFTLRSETPALWSAVLVGPGYLRPLWVVPFPRVSPAKFFSMAIPEIPSVGPLLVRTHLVNLAPAVCRDWTVVDTGGSPNGSPLP
jgi:uncharacterized repeat protein (TIGR03803 family)